MPPHQARVRWSSSLFASVAVAALVAACSGGGAANETSANPESAGGVPEDIAATLRVSVWDNWTELLVAAEEFKAVYPNVDFRFQNISNEYFRTLPQVLGSSDAPDITAVQAYAEATWTQIKAQQLVTDISGIFDGEDPDEIYAGLDDFKDETGALVALPMHVSWAPVIYYNKAVFDETGVSPPAGRVATPEEWDTMVRQLQDAGVVPLVPAGISDENGASFLLGSMAQTSCGESYQNLITNWQAEVELTTTWTSDCALAAVEELNAWAESGTFGSSPATLTLAQSRTLFAAGEAAMTASGGWEAIAPTWEADLDVDWFLPPPLGDGADTKFAIAQDDGLAVARRSENAELAKEFIAYVASKDFQSSPAYADAPGASPRQDVEAPEGYPPLAATQAEARGEIGSAPMVLDVPYASEFYLLLARMIAGEISPADVGEELARLNEEQRAA